MNPPQDPSQIPQWFQAGGLVLFSIAIWWEQRAIRRNMENQAKLTTAIAVKAGVRLQTEPPKDEIA